MRNGFVRNFHLPTQKRNFCPKNSYTCPRKPKFSSEIFFHTLWKNRSPKKHILPKKFLILSLKNNFFKAKKGKFWDHLKEPVMQCGLTMDLVPTPPPPPSPPPPPPPKKKKKSSTQISKKKRRKVLLLLKIFFSKTLVSLYLSSIFVFLCVIIFFSILENVPCYGTFLNHFFTPGFGMKCIYIGWKIKISLFNVLEQRDLLSSCGVAPSFTEKDDTQLWKNIKKL